MFPTANTHMFSPISVGAMATAHELTMNKHSKKPYPATASNSEKEETPAPKPKKAPIVVKPFMNPFGKPGII
ncbi:hypothetical protein HDU96_005752 [Phlyctochytrium bullatum]|nr:hypothetical protein HDU96_005752 [Phlyctochytrium bullatum]